MAMKKIIIFLAFANVAVRALRDDEPDKTKGVLDVSAEQPLVKELGSGTKDEGDLVAHKKATSSASDRIELPAAPRLSKEAAEARRQDILKTAGASFLEIPKDACTPANTWLQEKYLAQGQNAHVFRAADPEEWRLKKKGNATQRSNPYPRHIIKRAKDSSDKDQVADINAEAEIMSRAARCPKVMQAVEVTPCIVDATYQSPVYSDDGNRIIWKNDATYWPDRYETIGGSRVQGAYGGHLKSGDLYHKWTSTATTRSRQVCGPALFEDMFDALFCFHNEANYVHGDFKADNVMIDGITTREGQECPFGLQLADFGLSAEIDSIYSQYGEIYYAGSNHLPAGLFDNYEPTWGHVDRAFDYCSLLRMAHMDFGIQEPGIYLGGGSMFNGRQCGPMGPGRLWTPAGPSKKESVTHWVLDDEVDPCKKFHGNRQKIDYLKKKCTYIEKDQRRLLVKIQCEPGGRIQSIMCDSTDLEI